MKLILRMNVEINFVFVKLLINDVDGIENNDDGYDDSWHKKDELKKKITNRKRKQDKEK